MTSPQKGSTHVVIIVFLVISLVAALGWIFWQNVLHHGQKPSDTSSSASSKDSAPKKSQASQPKTISLSLTTVYAEGVSLKYPAGWKVLHLTPSGNVPPREDGSTSDSYIFTSPDNTIDLSLSQNSGGGLGGACDPDEEPALASFSYQASDAWAGKTYADSVVNRDGKYVVNQILSEGQQVKTIKAGDTSCAIGFLNIVTTGRKVGSSADIVMITGLSAHGVNNKVSFKSMQDAKLYLSSQNAKDVKSILLSIQ